MAHKHSEMWATYEMWAYTVNKISLTSNKTKYAHKGIGVGHIVWQKALRTIAVAPSSLIKY